MDELRPYQKEVILEIFKAFKKDNSVLIQMPTGTGKTHVFVDIIKKQLSKCPRKRILVLVHRKEILNQIVERIESFGMKAGTIISGTETNPEYQVQVASLQSIIRRKNKPRNISLIIVDEAHHILAQSYKRLIKYYADLEFLRLLGVSATPIRTNGEGFESVFDKLITSYSIKQFIKQGYLIPVCHFVTGLPDVSKVKVNKIKRDYENHELGKLMASKKYMSDLIESYKKYVDGKKGIIYAVNIKHAEDIKERYNREGIRAELIHAQTHKENRKKVVDDFKQGKIKILVNVEIFTEGFDCPDMDFIQLARPTKSLTLYLQMVGRVMRTFENKQTGYILDNAGLWKEHGLSTFDRRWSLKGQENTKSENTKIHIRNHYCPVKIKKNIQIFVTI